MTDLKLTIAALAACLLGCPIAEAKPSEARQALRILCPGHVDLAPHFDRAAGRYGLDAELLVSVAFVESSCDPKAVGPKGSVGLMQIMPGGSAAHGTPVNRLELPAVNVRLGARHIAKWWGICQDLAGALGVFSGRKTCKLGRESEYAKKVLELFEKAKGAKS